MKNHQDCIFWQNRKRKILAFAIIYQDEIVTTFKDLQSCCSGTYSHRPQ